MCCETAYTSYTNILTVIGGEKEKMRSKKLFQKIEVIPDIDSPTVDKVPVSSAVKDRSKVGAI